MRMILIYLVSALLALLPLLMALFFLVFMVPRKLLSMRVDRESLKASDITGGKLPQGTSGENSAVSTSPQPSVRAKRSRASAPDDEVRELVEEYFEKYSLFVPAIILTLFYVAGFLLFDAYTSNSFAANQWGFPDRFFTVILPIIDSFAGVYLFNLGVMTRRLYLEDLNEQVFWGAINRLLLSMGLSVILMDFARDQHFSRDRDMFFFVVGFIANVLLQWMLERILKLLNIAKPKRDDFPLRMIRGVNMWIEYRFEEEGIESVQNLATANLLELAVRTRYNFRTLIDWIDQAVALSLFSEQQIKQLDEHAVRVSAMTMALWSPIKQHGDKSRAQELAAVIGIDATLMCSILDDLAGDAYVEKLRAAISKD